MNKDLRSESSAALKNEVTGLLTTQINGVIHHGACMSMLGNESSSLLSSLPL